MMRTAQEPYQDNECELVVMRTAQEPYQDNEREQV